MPEKGLRAGFPRSPQRHDAGSAALIRPPTQLIQANRRATVSKRPRQCPAIRTRRPSEPTSHCQECGLSVEPPQRWRTEGDSACRTSPDHPRLARLAVVRADGQDPAHGGDAGPGGDWATARHVEQAAAWDQVNPRTGHGLFRQHILPALQQRTPQEIANATGLSRPYCALIRQGAYVPHPRHWDPLRLFSGR